MLESLSGSLIRSLLTFRAEEVSISQEIETCVF